ncbi:hypothetical protein [Dactylosporangium sp. CA-092794]|uniref:hypothetical protein n=1 Tax=Dactylosporangium sp. CA-092794 TaxID=3239929 RepID=UPI003D8F48A2
MRTSAVPDLSAVPAPTGPRWNWLHRVAAVAALLSAVFIPIQIAVFLAWPPPLDGTAVDWFRLLREHRLAGLIDLDLLLVADNVLLMPILLALYLALRRAYPSVMLLAVTLGFASVGMYLTTNPAVQLAALSDQYAAATTDAQRETATAAGTAMLAMWQGTAFHAGYLVGSTAGILLGAAMLGSGVFSRLTGWLAIAGNVMALGLYVPAAGVFIAVFSVLFLEAWYVLIAARLYRFGFAVGPSAARSRSSPGPGRPGPRRRWR